MIYKRVCEARFVKRLNRFVSICNLEGQDISVHVPNTGRCAELFIPGAPVILNHCSDEAAKTRKTVYDLVSIYKGDLLINLDSQAPNAIVEEALKNSVLNPSWDVTYLKREQTFGDSRFDIYYHRKAQGNLPDGGLEHDAIAPKNTKLAPDEIQGFIEVKGVTLEEDGLVYFPDAPTARGRKHLHELISAKNQGYEAAIEFVVQMDEASMFYPRSETDPQFAHDLALCQKAGVTIQAHSCKVTPDRVILDHSIDICDLSYYL